MDNPSTLTAEEQVLSLVAAKTTLERARDLLEYDLSHMEIERNGRWNSVPAELNERPRIHTNHRLHDPSNCPSTSQLPFITSGQPRPRDGLNSASSTSSSNAITKLPRSALKVRSHSATRKVRQARGLKLHGLQHERDSRGLDEIQSGGASEGLQHNGSDRLSKGFMFYDLNANEINADPDSRQSDTRGLDSRPEPRRLKDSRRLAGSVVGGAHNDDELKERLTEFLQVKLKQTLENKLNELPTTGPSRNELAHSIPQEGGHRTHALMSGQPNGVHNDTGRRRNGQHPAEGGIHQIYSRTALEAMNNLPKNRTSASPSPNVSTGTRPYIAPGVIPSLQNRFDEILSPSSNDTNRSFDSSSTTSRSSNAIIDASTLPNGQLDLTRLRKLLSAQRREFKDRIRIEKAKREALQELLLELESGPSSRRSSVTSDSTSTVTENRNGTTEKTGSDRRHQNGRRSSKDKLIAKVQHRLQEMDTTNDVLRGNDMNSNRNAAMRALEDGYNNRNHVMPSGIQRGELNPTSVSVQPGVVGLPDQADSRLDSNTLTINHPPIITVENHLPSPQRPPQSSLANIEASTSHCHVGPLRLNSINEQGPGSQQPSSRLEALDPSGRKTITPEVSESNNLMDAFAFGSINSSMARNLLSGRYHFGSHNDLLHPTEALQPVIQRVNSVEQGVLTHATTSGRLITVPPNKGLGQLQLDEIGPAVKNYLGGRYHFGSSVELFRPTHSRDNLANLPADQLQNLTRTESMPLHMDRIQEFHSNFGPGRRKDATVNPPQRPPTIFELPSLAWYVEIPKNGNLIRNRIETGRAPIKVKGINEKPSLQDCLERSRPRFIVASRSRQRAITAASHVRANAERHLRDLAAEVAAGQRTMPSPGCVNVIAAQSRVSAFPISQMVQQTKKKYRQLPEYQQKLLDERIAFEKTTNRVMAAIYKQKILNGVLSNPRHYNRRSSYNIP